MSDTSGFFGGSTPAVKFDAIGDTVTGQVIDKELRQITDPDSGKLQTWPDGRPKMQAVVTLQVGQPTEDDPGLRLLYVRGYMQREFVTALRAQRLRDLAVGMWVKVIYTHQDDPQAEGQSGAKHFEVKVAPKQVGRAGAPMRKVNTAAAQDTEPPGDDDVPF